MALLSASTQLSFENSEENGEHISCNTLTLDSQIPQITFNIMLPYEGIYSIETKLRTQNSRFSHVLECNEKRRPGLTHLRITR